MSPPNWRMSVTEETARKKSSGGKGGKGSWHDRLSLPRAGEAPPAAIILLKAEYPDNFPDQMNPGKQPVMKPYYKARIHKRAVNPNTPAMPTPPRWTAIMIATASFAGFWKTVSSTQTTNSCVV